MSKQAAVRHHLCPFSGYAVWDTLSHVWASVALRCRRCHHRLSAARVVQQASLAACALGRARAAHQALVGAVGRDDTRCADLAGIYSTGGCRCRCRCLSERTSSALNQSPSRLESPSCSTVISPPSPHCLSHGLELDGCLLRCRQPALAAAARCTADN